MRCITWDKGLTTIELVITIAVAVSVGAGIFSTFSVWRANSVVTDTHREASVYLSALHEYYWRYCDISPFPQPSYAILKDTNILIHQVDVNPISNTNFVPSIEWVGTSRATAVLTLQFDNSNKAFKVAAGSRQAEQVGNSVVWRRSLSRLNSALAGFKGAETEIFASGKCQA